eukprot:TRINITY_DN14664_c0_g1_i1.p2 TRINITY_DN14664_c0_g1~~TRINITY_DN14664_c0_g1_i1.p2  ORF type:complete len:107 (+),score=22.77 TRINITY_DN14664_c0_g1_i1:61-381(+)
MCIRDRYQRRVHGDNIKFFFYLHQIEKNLTMMKLRQGPNLRSKTIARGSTLSPSSQILQKTAISKRSEKATKQPKKAGREAIQGATKKGKSQSPSKKKRLQRSLRE